MSLYQTPDDLARELGQWIRAREVSPETQALLEADAARQLRQHHTVRQLAFLAFVVPWIVAVVAFGVLVAAGMLSAG